MRRNLSIPNEFPMQTGQTLMRQRNPPDAHIILAKFASVSRISESIRLINPKNLLLAMPKYLLERLIQPLRKFGVWKFHFEFPWRRHESFYRGYTRNNFSLALSSPLLIHHVRLSPCFSFLPAAPRSGTNISFRLPHTPKPVFIYQLF